MKEDLNMDKAIREKLESFSVDPPAHVWNNMREAMVEKRRKKRMAYIGWVAAAAVVVFAFIAGWMLNEKSTPLKETLVEKQVVQPLEEQKVQPVENQNNISIENQQETELASAAIKTPILPEKIEAESLAQVSKKDDSNKKVLNESEVLKRETIYQILVARTEVVFSKEAVELRTREVKEIQPEDTPTLSESDHLLIAENIRQSDTNKGEEKGWVVGAHVSPGYSAHSSNYSDRYARDMNQVSDGGVGNVGGGLSVQYKSNERLSIESGVYYAQNSQSKGGSTGRLFAVAPMMDFASGPVADADNLYTNAVRVSQQGIAMNSTAGVVNMGAPPEGAELSMLNDARKNIYNTTLLADGEFSQEFDLVEIPLYLRYKLIDKKIGIDVLGGVNAGLVVGNNAYIKNDNGKQNVGETADISTVNLSGTIGFGVNYALGKHFSLGLEPRLNYYLNSINSNPDVDYKPYRIALFTGVYYEF